MTNTRSISFARLLIFLFLLAVTLQQPSSGGPVGEMFSLFAPAAHARGATGAAFQTAGVNPSGDLRTDSHTVSIGRSRAVGRSLKPASDWLGGYAPATAASAQSGPLASGASGKLVRSTDLEYLGSFQLPRGPVGGSSFDYGGNALAFNSVGGSLFLVGHAQQQLVAEVAVPAIRRATTMADFAVATVLQPFADAADGRLRSVEEDQSQPVSVSGLLPYGGKLYLAASVYYDANGSQRLSHFVSGMDLSVKGDVRGPYRVGNLGAGAVSGYFGLIPAEWQGALGGPVLNGNCCLSIISRTSYGPAAFAIDPTKLGTTDPLPAVPLVYYPGAHPLGPYGDRSTFFNGSTNVNGVVFPEGTRSVLFFGKQGTGPICYGPGTGDPALAGTGPPGEVLCHDPMSAGKGYHAYPYLSYVWAYDAADLAAVKSGQRQPWDVKPYAVWDLDLPFVGSIGVLGAAYDAKTGRIFLSLASDGANPLIHVLTVRN